MSELSKFEIDKHLSMITEVANNTKLYFCELVWNAASAAHISAQELIKQYIEKGDKYNPTIMHEKISLFTDTEINELNVLINKKNPDNYNQKICNLFDEHINNLDKGKRLEECKKIIFLDSDLAASIKMLMFCNNNINNQLKKWSKKGNFKSKLGECLTIRNDYIGHVNNKILSKLDAGECEKVLSSFKNAVDFFPNIPDGYSALRKTKQKADELIDEYLRMLHCSPITLDELENIDGVTEELITKSNYNEYYDPETKQLFWHKPEQVKRDLWEQINQRKQLETEEQFWNSDNTKNYLNYLGYTKTEPSSEDVLARPEDEDVEQDRRSSYYEWIKEVFPKMSEYERGHLTAAQLDELAANTAVLANADFWLDRNCNKFLAYEMKDILKRNGHTLIIDWDTRVEIFNQEKNMNGKVSDEQIINAKRAHNTMHLMVNRKFAKYLPPSNDLFLSNRGIIEIAKENPKTIFTVLTGSNDFCQTLKEQSVKNVIPIYYLPAIGACAVRTSQLDNVKRIFRDTSEGKGIIKESVNNPENKQKVDIPKKTITKSAPKVEKNKVQKERNNKKPKNNDKRKNGRIRPENNEVINVAELPGKGEVAYTSDGEKIKLIRQLGAGGEGIVYETDKKGIVAKIYLPEKITQNRKEKLKTMVDRQMNISKVCWPQKLVVNSKGEFIGYLMKNVSGYKEFGVTVLKLNSNKVATKHMPGWDRLALVELCISLCDTFIKLHKKGVMMGDVNPRNMMLNPEDPSHTDFVFVDCDSYQIDEYPCPVGTVVFTSPKLYDRTHKSSDKLDFGTVLRKEEDEDYAVASLLFHILLLNQSPFAGKGVTNLEKAIRDYNFAFRLPNQGNSGAETPDGPYRMIWDNTPKYIKECFGIVFKEGKNVTLEQWKRKFIDYKWDIEAGYYTKELKPVLYRDVGGYCTMFKCAICGKERNMPTKRYTWQEEHYEPHLCNDCWSISDTLKKTKVKLFCMDCGKPFETNEWEHWKFEHTNKKCRCDDCRERHKARFKNNNQ